jgi:hypothetical protein
MIGILDLALPLTSSQSWNTGGYHLRHKVEVRDVSGGPKVRPTVASAEDRATLLVDGRLASPHRSPHQKMVRQAVNVHFCNTYLQLLAMKLTVATKMTDIYDFVVSIIRSAD